MGILGGSLFVKRKLNFLLAWRGHRLLHLLELSQTSGHSRSRSQVREAQPKFLLCLLEGVSFTRTWPRLYFGKFCDVMACRGGVLAAS